MQNASAAKNLSPASVCRNFCDGLAVPWRGFCHMAMRPGLWRFALAPLLLNLLVTCLLTLFLALGGIAVFSKIHAAFAGSWWRLPIEALAFCFFIVTAIGVLMAAWLIVQSVLCVWFYDRLARKVETQIGLEPGELRDIPLGPQIADALRDALLLIAINIACLAVQIVPLIGTVVGTCGSYYFTCSSLGYAFLDYPLSLRGMRRREKLLFVRRHRSHSLGLGTSAMFLAIVPIVNAVFLTTAVVGAVLLYRGIRD